MNYQVSPDEAKVTELKRIVVACGVRKQWYVRASEGQGKHCLTSYRSKEFADYPTVGLTCSMSALTGREVKVA